MKLTHIALATLLLTGLTGCFDGGVSLAERGDDHDPDLTRSEGLEYAPQMYHSIPYEPYTQLDYNPANTENGEVLPHNYRHAPASTVPYRGSAEAATYPAMPYGPAAKLWASPDSMTKYYEAAATELAIPSWIPATEDVYAEGQRLYELYCDHCHGAKGEGDGPISKAEKIIVPSYLAADRIILPPGKIYFSISYGKGAMGPHHSQVNAMERWILTRYVLKLQGRENDYAGAPNTPEAAPQPAAPAPQMAPQPAPAGEPVGVQTRYTE